MSTAKMTSRKRVMTAFAHSEPDQVPVDFGGMCCSMINALVMKDLRDYYGLEKRPPRINDMSTMTAFVEPDLADCLGCDVQQLYNYGDTYGHINDNWKEWTYFGETVLIPGNCTIHDDGKGGYFVYPEGDDSVPSSGHMPNGSYYFDNTERSPEFDEDDSDPMDNVADNKPVGDAQIASHRALLQKLKAKGNERAIQVGIGYFGLGDANNIPGPNLKHPKGIRDIAEWYMAPMLYPEYVEEMFDKTTDISVQSLKKYWEAFGSDIDIVFICGTDFGTQNGPLMNPTLIRDMYVPYYKKMNDWIHENTTWKTLKHSCGAVYDVIPYLIEAGFDALNPVQCSAAGMDPQRLKDAYGKDIVFWGGGVDTQKVLPFGTPEEVREQVLERLSIFSKGGGYIFNSIHNIQANTPIPNIVAMVDAIKEFNGQR